MILTKQYRCIHSASCQCTKGHISEEAIFLVFQQLNWNPKLIATLSCVCKWFDDVAKRVLWKEFCKTRAPKMMIDLQSSGSHSVDGNWRALGKLLIYCTGSKKGGLFNSIQIPGHFVYRTRFSRTSGKSFLLPQCRTDVLYVSDPCEHLDQGEEGDVGFFRGIFKSFSMSKVRKMLIKKGAQLHPTEVCPYCKAKLWSMLQAKMIPQSASCRRGGGIRVGVIDAQKERFLAVLQVCKSQRLDILVGRIGSLQSHSTLQAFSHTMKLLEAVANHLFSSCPFLKIVAGKYEISCTLCMLYNVYVDRNWFVQ